MGEIEALYPKVSDHYPEKRIQKMFETKVGSFGPVEGMPSAETKDRGVVGFQFWAKDLKQVCRFGLDGFSFSRLRPYSDWDSSFPEAMRLWSIYTKSLTLVKSDVWQSDL